MRKPKPPDSFGQRLLDLRERAGLSRYALAKSSGVSPQHLMRLERGEQQPSLAVAQKVAGALGVTLAAWEGCRPA